MKLHKGKRKRENDTERHFPTILLAGTGGKGEKGKKEETLLSSQLEPAMIGRTMERNWVSKDRIDKPLLKAKRKPKSGSKSCRIVMECFIFRCMR